MTFVSLELLTFGDTAFYLSIIYFVDLHECAWVLKTMQNWWCFEYCGTDNTDQPSTFTEAQDMESVHTQ